MFKFKTLWNDKSKAKDVVNNITSATPLTYKLGYQLHTKDGAICTRFYERVSAEERQTVRDTVEAEVAVIEARLNEASINKKEFVNLNGTVIRTSDFSKVVIFDSINDSKYNE